MGLIPAGYANLAVLAVTNSTLTEPSTPKDETPTAMPTSTMLRLPGRTTTAKV